MLIDSELTTIVSWKNMLLGNFVESAKEFGEKDGEIFYFIEGDFTKSSVKGIPTIAFSNQSWTLEFNPCQFFSSVVKAWIRLLGLPKYLYNKRILEETGGLIGKVAKLDFNTDSGLRGQFARMYGHVKELCRISTGDKDLTGENKRAKMAESIVGVTVENTAKFGPWMVIERRSYQSPKESRKTATKNLVSIEGRSRFRALISSVNEKGEKKDIEANILGIHFRRGDFI
ncbi:hypothetical protein PVK06_001177 [Gossypium arboreum]|uniref:DUF4283 domain-containing protein n=1 Tax=Gossypium arboreum TaxID=29729 RepID=A0ABR0R0A4_GOSAR|nr:hypothetical protein PVK06_001177 [Gossypium arboreum]